MRYVLKQKLLSLASDFVIRDADARDVFFVKGRVFSLGAKLSFQDMQGNEIVFIKQRLLAWRPTYEIYHGGALIATVRKALLTFFGSRFSIELPGPYGLEVTGNFLAHEYTFRYGGDVVAQVSKQWFAWTDTYGVDIADGQNDVLLLACAVVIDLACHGRKKSGFNIQLGG
ncbi:MAG: LURP-one-related family protein [Verrucomicrobia bacterium]|nr:LURP-one-related family protein [Verrucomicrobiota bacterium]